MSSIIDTTYFENNGIISIPLGSTDELNEVLISNITKYEPKFLKLLLGYTEYTAFKAAYELSILDKENAEYAELPERWDHLLNGAEIEFEVNGLTIKTKWEGLINDEKNSPIANYVYYKHRNATDSNYTGVGETKSATANSYSVDPIERMVEVWNDGVEMYGVIPRRELRYQSFLNNGNYIHYNELPSAYNFLLVNIDDYPDWVFTPLMKINPFF